MLRKIFVLILLSTVLSLAAFAQDAAPKPDEGRGANRVFSLAFGGGSYLGVEIQEVNKSNYAEFGLSEVRGVKVSRVFENSPADKAGLKEGDVIVGFDGQSVTSSRKLTRLISEVAPDHTVNVTVVRGGSELSVPVTVGKREMPGFSNGNFVFPRAPRPVLPPDAPDAPDAPPPPPGRFEFNFPDMQVMPRGDGMNYLFTPGNRRVIGVGVSSLSEQLGSYFGVDGGDGLLITSVEKDSPAEKAGLRAGDVIVEANGAAVKGSNDLTKALNAEKEGDISLTVIRDKKRRSFNVTPEKAKGTQWRIGTDIPEIFERYREAAPKTTIRLAPAPGGVSRPVIVNRGSTVLR